MDNLKEFNELIKKYESITLEEIKAAGDFKSGYDADRTTVNKITGFGSLASCTLCIPINVDCDVCVWIAKTEDVCNEQGNEPTYANIENAENRNELLKAFKARAKYMKKVLNK